MNPNATPRPSSLPSTMTPRLHENPLASLRCAARALATTTMPGSVHSPPRAWVGYCTPSARNVVRGVRHRDYFTV